MQPSQGPHKTQQNAVASCPQVGHARMLAQPLQDRQFEIVQVGYRENEANDQIGHQPFFDSGMGRVKSCRGQQQDGCGQACEDRRLEPGSDQPMPLGAVFADDGNFMLNVPCHTKVGHVTDDKQERHQVGINPHALLAVGAFHHDQYP